MRMFAVRQRDIHRNQRLEPFDSAPEQVQVGTVMLSEGFESSRAHQINRFNSPSCLATRAFLCAPAGTTIWSSVESKLSAALCGNDACGGASCGESPAPPSGRAAISIATGQQCRAAGFGICGGCNSHVCCSRAGPNRVRWTHDRWCFSTTGRLQPYIQGQKPVPVMRALRLLLACGPPWRTGPMFWCRDR